MTDKLVTVIIPTFNCESTIRSAIESILAQTYNNLEVIVVDDNCTDKTASIVEEMCKSDKRLKIIKTEIIDPKRFNRKLKRNINAGYSARNTGLKYAKGQYITFQDADDISLLNRIEIQVELLEQYKADHITTDWIKLNERFLGKKIDFKKFIDEIGLITITPNELYDLAEKTKGILMKTLGHWHKYIPFNIKRMRFINRSFFGSVTPYPGVTGIPLFKKEITEKVKFRKLSERIWPSFMGRGADRDFSFQVVEIFKNSYVFYIPLYMWRVRNDNPRYPNGINKYIIN